MSSKALIAFAIMCAFVASINASDCPKICPDLYAPVCGTDGRIYQEFVNACELNVSNCNLYMSLKTTHIDWCRTKDLGTIGDLLKTKYTNLDMNKPECLKTCIKMYEPLCVSNGKYRVMAPNQCMLDNFNCALGESDNFRVLRNGTC